MLYDASRTEKTLSLLSSAGIRRRVPGHSIQLRLQKVEIPETSIEGKKKKGIRGREGFGNAVAQERGAVI
jgi:hypothetical protein